ncbi:hypothetical protein POM88_018555 [Heracleum sosnowskyi]|uniref:Replication protein A OB domain-containing protein n=1 Tax=Heracleum sosnowskyi TaxID=360622 RepID=A0AAD8MZG0_9APIA|nr:hypothetical protein POM88_018555 [Heracleum sosnowskyi]
MGTYKLLKDMKLGEGKESIKVRVSREWGGRKPGSVHVYKFEIETFDDARSRKGDVVNLIDVVGKLTKSTLTDNGKKTLEIVLKDESVKIVLWENQAYDFLHYKTDCEKPNVFLLVTGTTSKLVKGEHVLWSSSSTNYFFNIDNPAIISLRANMKDDLIPDIIPIIKSHAQSTVEDIERVAIQQLFDAQLLEGKNAIAFTIEATILELIPIYDGWCYMGCKRCI